MAIYRFEVLGKNIIWEIESVERRAGSKPIDHQDFITNKALVEEIDNFMRTYYDDENLKETDSFKIATKLKRSVFMNDVLMFGYMEVQNVYQILMFSDYSDAIFWDDEGACVGGSYGLHYFNFSKELEEELKDWQHGFEEDCGRWDADSWIKYNARGIELAKKVKNELGDMIDLDYEKPFEDPSFKKGERIKILI